MEAAILGDGKISMRLGIAFLRELLDNNEIMFIYGVPVGLVSGGTISGRKIA